ncbi:MAG: Integral rane sensor signal transduction histidine kinase [Pedosphaera sp.]|nr:Integral rane sensor signal transduction histidine kinase [Pedosphaera sp.]
MSIARVGCGFVRLMIKQGGEDGAGALFWPSDLGVKMKAARAISAIQTISRNIHDVWAGFSVRHKVLHLISLYGMGIAAVALMGGLRALAAPLVGHHHVYTFFFAAIAITSWCAGFWPSILAILLSYLTADWFFIAPHYTFDFHNYTADDFVGLGAFVVSGLAIASTSEGLHRARQRAEMKQQQLEKEATERKRVQQALEQAQAELQKHAGILEQRVAERTARLTTTIQSLEGVCYHIAHDLRAPLRAMQGFAALLLDDHAPNLGEAGASYARWIAESAVRMDTLIHGLLDYGRLGHLKVSLVGVELETQLESVLLQLRTEVMAKGAEIRVERPLPLVLGDAMLVDLILLNLLGNALKFVAPGAAPRIRVRAEVGMKAARLWIEDQGIGIPLEYQQKTFGIFERLHGDQSYPGSGIGLAIVAEAAQRIGGHVGVQSEPGRGSRFWVEFQLAKNHNSALLLAQLNRA